MLSLRPRMCSVSFVSQPPDHLNASIFSPRSNTDYFVKHAFLYSGQANFFGTPLAHDSLCKASRCYLIHCFGYTVNSRPSRCHRAKSLTGCSLNWSGRDEPALLTFLIHPHKHVIILEPPKRLLHAGVGRTITVKSSQASRPDMPFILDLANISS